MNFELWFLVCEELKLCGVCLFPFLCLPLQLFPAQPFSRMFSVSTTPPSPTLYLQIVQVEPEQRAAQTCYDDFRPNRVSPGYKTLTSSKMLYCKHAGDEDPLYYSLIDPVTPAQICSKTTPPPPPPPPPFITACLRVIISPHQGSSRGVSRIWVRRVLRLLLSTYTCATWLFNWHDQPHSLSKCNWP